MPDFGMCLNLLGYEVNNKVLQYLCHNYIVVVTWIKVTILISLLFTITTYKDMLCF